MTQLARTTTPHDDALGAASVPRPRAKGRPDAPRSTPPGRSPAARLVRLERPSVGEERRMAAEVEAFPAHLLAALPLATTLLLHVPGVEGRPVAVATSQGALDVARAAGLLAFDADEWRVLVSATESDRLWPADFRAVIVGKSLAGRGASCAEGDPAADAAADARLDAAAAFGDARPDPVAGWSVGRVLARLGARLVGVELGP